MKLALRGRIPLWCGVPVRACRCNLPASRIKQGATPASLRLSPREFRGRTSDRSGAYSRFAIMARTGMKQASLRLAQDQVMNSCPARPMPTRNQRRLPMLRLVCTWPGQALAHANSLCLQYFQTPRSRQASQGKARQARPLPAPHPPLASYARPKTGDCRNWRAGVHFLTRPVRVQRLRQKT